MGRPLAEVVEDLEVAWETGVQDGDIVTDMIVVMKVVRMDQPGVAHVQLSAPETTDHVTIQGLISSAGRLADWWYRQDGDD